MVLNKIESVKYFKNNESTTSTKDQNFQWTLQCKWFLGEKRYTYLLTYGLLNLLNLNEIQIKVSNFHTLKYFLHAIITSRTQVFTFQVY